ncbi:MAG: transporter related [Herbinix sp.]|jgi:ABC-type multidrug transport system fused ATPase/permease subunit|nr:transporter related [Herbinix sp.]
MLKRYLGVLPYLVLSILVAAVSNILDGEVARRMLKLLDYALAGDMDTIKNNTPILIVMALALIPLGIVVAIVNNYYKRKAMVALKKHYLIKVFGKNIAEFQKENNAKYISSITNDLNTLELNLITGVYTIGNGITKFFVGIWLLSTVDPRMILLAIGIIILNLIQNIITSRPINKAFKERSDMFDGYTSYIKEVLSAFHIVKNYNLQKKVQDDYNEKSVEIQQKGFLIERMLSFIFSFQNVMFSSSFYGILCLVGYYVLRGEITAGGLILVVDSIQRMMWPIMEISEAMPKIMSTGDLMKKIDKTLENADTYPETVELSEFKQEISFNNVQFGYEDSEELTLRDVNLKLKKGGKYLIVGPSGGGKSTLLKLFRKYFNPTDGNITIDGDNLKDIKREDYYKLIANIEQQVFIFEDTLKNNITLYKDYSEEEITKAIGAAGLTDFVANLPDGINTMIYDNGRNISGGEKSRVVIARAFLSKASILFMDEAFASLDMERAREIEKTILALKDITVINVSHIIFQDTKELYDRVITVKRGIV